MPAATAGGRWSLPWRYVGAKGFQPTSWLGVTKPGIRTTFCCSRSSTATNVNHGSLSQVWSSRNCCVKQYSSGQKVNYFTHPQFWRLGNLDRATNRQDGRKEVFGTDRFRLRMIWNQARGRRPTEIGRWPPIMQDSARRGCGRYRANRCLPRDSV